MVRPTTVTVDWITVSGSRQKSPCLFCKTSPQIKMEFVSIWFSEQRSLFIADHQSERESERGLTPVLSHGFGQSPVGRDGVVECRNQTSD